MVGDNACDLEEELALTWQRYDGEDAAKDQCMSDETILWCRQRSKELGKLVN